MRGNNIGKECSVFLTKGVYSTPYIFFISSNPAPLQLSKVAILLRILRSEERRVGKEC